MIRSSYLGLDNGQATDPAAWTLCERQTYIRDKLLSGKSMEELATFSNLHATAYSRFSLRTPYTEIIRKMAAIVSIPELCRDVVMVVDCTRERAVYDLIRESPDFHGITVIPVVITGGNHVSVDTYGWYNVPESEILSALTVSLEGQRLMVERGGGQEKGDAEEMEDELKNIKRRVSAKRKVVGMSVDGTDVDHDDMAFSLALAVWYAKYIGAFEGPKVYLKHEIKPFDPARAGLTQ